MEQPDLFDGPTMLSDGSVQVSWLTATDTDYRLERSTNLVDWTEVTTLTATSDVLSVTDSSVPPSAPMVFWRTYELGAAQVTSQPPVEVSEISVQPVAQEQGSFVGLALQAGADVESIAFYENGNLLTNANPGPGGVYTASLIATNTKPQVRNIQATVTKSDGSTLTLFVHSFLQADYSRFVPVNADGTLAYGQYVGVNSAGQLDAFHYYPEGLGDRTRVTGAHFEFDSGATLDEHESVLHFTSGRFARGFADPSPADLAGSKALPLDGIAPDAVRTVVGIPADTPVRLLWGVVDVTWADGTLGSDGWRGLQIRPLFDVDLPALSARSQVAQDPESGKLYLVTSFHGDWSPLPGAIAFHIPAEDPLSVYLPLDGAIMASGGVVVDLPNGASVRGSASWRDPNFEVTLEGRNIVVPAMDTLSGILPSDPDKCIPDGDAGEDLDTAAKQLAGIRDAYRGLIQGSLAQTPADSTSDGIPMPRPTYAAGSALRAWAGRLQSWPADRAGESLSADEISDLTNVLENAAQTAGAAHDLATVLTLLRHVLVVRDCAPAAAGTSEAAASLIDALPGLEDRLFASANRIINDAPSFKEGPALEEVVDLIGDLQVVNGSAGYVRYRGIEDATPQEKTDDGLYELSHALLQKTDHSIYGGVYNIVAGEFDGTKNPALMRLTVDGLLQLLRQIEYDQKQLEQAREKDPSSPLTTELGSYPLVAARYQAMSLLPVKLAEDCRRAVEGGSPEDIIRVLEQRLALLHFYALFQYPIPPDDGSSGMTRVYDLVKRLQHPYAEQLWQLPLKDRIAKAKSTTAVIQQLQAKLGDAELTALWSKEWTFHSDANGEVMAALLGCWDCGDLANELRSEGGYPVKNLHYDDDGSQRVIITGKYETDTSSGDPAGSPSLLETLQINQAGRYFSGYIQLHNRAHATVCNRIEGQLSGEDDSAADFAYVVRTDNGPLYGVLHATRLEDGSVSNLVLTDKANGLPRTFIAVDYRAATYADSVIDRMVPSEKALVHSLERCPLHREQRSAVELTLQDIMPIVVEYASDHNAELHAEDIERVLTMLYSRSVAVDQAPQVNLIFQQVLSSLAPEGSSASYWQNIVSMMGHVSDSSAYPYTMDTLGGLPDQSESFEPYTYTFHFLNETVEAKFRKVFRVGAMPMLIEVNKSSETEQDESSYVGAFLNVGCGYSYDALKKFQDTAYSSGDLLGLQPGAIFSALLGAVKQDAALPIAFMNFESTVELESFINYRPEDLVGPAVGIMGDLGGKIGIPVPAQTGGIEVKVMKVKAGGLWLFGSGEKLPLFVPLFPDYVSDVTPIGLGLQPFQVKAEVSAGVVGRILGGYVFEEFSTASELPPFHFKTRKKVDQDRLLFFDLGKSRLTECGWETIRRFASEYAALLTSPLAAIHVIGMTDTLGDGPANTELSLDRANVVRDALLEVLGPQLLVSTNAVMAVGLGEEAARADLDPDIVAGEAVTAQSDSPLPLGPDEPWLSKFIQNRRDRVPAIANNVKDANWRAVSILVNDTAVLDLSTPGGSRR